MTATVVKEELSLSEESDEEEWRWHGSSGGDDTMDKEVKLELEGMEDKEEDEMKLRQLKRDRENKWHAQRSEIRRRLLAGEDPPEVGEELRKKILKQWERKKEYGRRRREEEKKKRRDMDKVRGRVKREFQRRGPRKRKYPELTPEEQRKMRREKDKFRLLEKRLNMTEEEREEDRRRKFFQMEAWRATLTKEEKEEMRRRQSERERRRYEGKSEEEKRMMVERHKGWRRNLSEEKKRRYLEGVYKCIKRNNERKKREDPEGWRRKMAENGKRQWQRMGEEQRERRRKMMKLYQWKRRFRGELEGMGEGKEGVERRVKEEEERLRKEWGIGPPRPRGNFKRKGNGNKVEGIVEETKEINRAEGGEEEGGGGDGDDYFYDCEPAQPEVEEMEVSSMEKVLASPPPPSNFVPFENVVGENCAVNVTAAPPLEPVGTLEVAVVKPDVKLKTFLCEFCPRSISIGGGGAPIKYFAEEELKVHLKAKHFTSCWKCPICFEVVLAPEHLSEHFIAVHKSLVKKSENIPPASISLTKSENNKEKVETKKEVEKIIKKFRTFLCMKCPWTDKLKEKTFKCSRQLHSHVKKKHRKYYWPCKHCNLLKYSNERLRLHQKICKTLF